MGGRQPISDLKVGRGDVQTDFIADAEKYLEAFLEKHDEIHMQGRLAPGDQEAEGMELGQVADVLRSARAQSAVLAEMEHGAGRARMEDRRRADGTRARAQPERAIDELMDADFGAKLDSAQLGLDGQLIEQVVEEVDLAKLLEKAVRNFDPTAPTIDERDMEREWEDSLKHRLTAAEAAFRLHHRHKAGAQFSVVEPPSPLTIALAARKRARKKRDILFDDGNSEMLRVDLGFPPAS